MGSDQGQTVVRPASDRGLIEVRAGSDPGLSRVPALMFLLAALFFLSGTSALIYQMLWLRLIGLVFALVLFAGDADAQVPGPQPSTRIPVVGVLYPGVPDPDIGASSRFSSFGSASNASLMWSRNTARMIQPPRHKRAQSP